MGSLKVKDNSPICKYKVDSEISKIKEEILDKTLEHLVLDGVFFLPEQIKEADDLSKHQLILRSSRSNLLEYKTGNLMGFLNYMDESFIISSRFSDENNDFFLLYVLRKVLGMPNTVNMWANANHEIQLFNFLIYLFPCYLKNAMRKGIFREYIRYQYNDKNVKGTVDIARHIKKNTPFTGNIAYSQRELSSDNPLMQLVRHTIEFIKKEPWGQNILAKAKDEIRLISEITPSYKPSDTQKLIAQNFRKSVTHAYFSEYRKLQRLCLLILQNTKTQICTGSNQVYGILFDGSWLWEEYLSTIIGHIFHHPNNRKKEHREYLFKQRQGEIYPDFIGKDKKHRMILDAKYKFREKNDNKDYFQLLAYMFRFESNLGFCVYPEIGVSKEDLLILDQGLKYEDEVSQRREDIVIRKYGLKIPTGCENFEDFATEMEKSEQEFLNTLLKYSRY